MEYANISHKYNYFCGGDMHSKTTYFVVLDRSGNCVRKSNLSNCFLSFNEFIKPYRDQVVVGVESNFNYPWLFDGCSKEDIPFVLGHAPYIRAISGNKKKNDKLDAHTIANLMRTNYFPVGYAYPREIRIVRDLLRRRHFFVRQRSGLITHSKLTFFQQGIYDNKASVYKNKEQREYLTDRLEETDLKLNVDTNIKVIGFLDETIDYLEQTIKEKVKQEHIKSYALLQTIPGVGEMTSLIIIYETCDINRFKTHQKYASYCRVVKPERMSNGIFKKSKNAKMGNPYLKWVFGGILHNARMSEEEIDKYYLRLEKKYGPKKSRAIMAHKFNTAVYFMLKRQIPFDMDKFLKRN